MSDTSKITPVKNDSVSTRSAKKRRPSLTNCAKPRKETSLYQELQVSQKPVIVSGDGSLRVRKVKKTGMSREGGRKDVSSRSKKKTRQKTDERRLRRLTSRILQRMKALNTSKRTVREGDDTYDGTMDESELTPNIDPMAVGSADTIKETVPKTVDRYELVKNNNENDGNLFIKEGSRTIPFWMKKRGKGEKLPVKHLNAADVKVEMDKKKKLDPFPEGKIFFDEGDDLEKLKAKDIYFTHEVLLGTTGRPIMGYIDPDISERSRRVQKKKKATYKPPTVTFEVEPGTQGGVFSTKLNKLRKKLSGKD